MTESQEQEHFKNAMDTIHPKFRNLARKSYEKSRSTGQTHAAAMTTMRTMFAEEVESIDELSSETLKSHNDKVRAEPMPRNTFKIVKRILAKRRASEKLHDKEVDVIAKKIGRTNEDLVDENLSQSSKEGKIARGTNKNLGPVKKMMGNKTALSTYIHLIDKTKE